MRRLIPPWEYRDLRFWAAVRTGAGIVLIALGLITRSFGGNGRKTNWWTIAFLAVGAAQFFWACWELTIARSEPPRV